MPANATNMTGDACSDVIVEPVCWGCAWHVVLSFLAGLSVGLAVWLLDRCYLRPPPYATQRLPPSALALKANGAGGGFGHPFAVNQSVCSPVAARAGTLPLAHGWANMPPPSSSPLELAAGSPKRRCRPAAAYSGGSAAVPSPLSPQFSHAAAWASPRCAAAMLKPDDALASRLPVHSVRHTPSKSWRATHADASPIAATLAADRGAAEGWNELVDSWQRYEVKHPISRV